jgi:hypothetical protein
MAAALAPWTGPPAWETLGETSGKPSAITRANIFTTRRRNLVIPGPFSLNHDFACQPAGSIRKTTTDSLKLTENFVDIYNIKAIISPIHQSFQKVKPLIIFF